MHYIPNLKGIHCTKHPSLFSFFCLYFPWSEAWIQDPDREPASMVTPMLSSSWRHPAPQNSLTFWACLPFLSAKTSRGSIINTWVLLWCFGCVHAQSHLTLCNPMNCSPPGSSVHGILQARILEWVAMPSSRGSSRPGDRTYISCIVRQIPYHWATWGVACT